MQSSSIRLPDYKPFGIFRLFLAILVVPSHLGGVAPAIVGHYLRPIEPGTIAVYIFFVASGLIITEAVHRFYWLRPNAFLMNRFIRLLPLAVFAMATNTALWAVLRAHGDRLFPRSVEIVTLAVVRLLPFTKIFPLEFEPLPISWTLRVEFIFYFLCFLILLVGPLIDIKRHKHTVVAAGAAILTALFAADQIRGSASLLRFIPYFAAGAAAYFAGDKDHRRLALPCLFVALCGIGVENFTTPVNHPTLGHARDRNTQQLILIVLLSVFFWLSTRRVGSRFAAVDRFAGEMSYPLYIGHYTAAIICSPLGSASWSLTAVFALLAAAVTGALWFNGERPLALLREQIRGVSLAVRPKDISVEAENGERLSGPLGRRLEPSE
jgi:peptidoglycan/LPS O-acetylase OafA/YrhL